VDTLKDVFENVASQIYGTVGPSHFCSPRRMLHSCTPTSIDRVNALKNTWFVLSTSIKSVRNPKGLQFCYRLIKMRIKIISQIDRPFVAQTTVLKHHKAAVMHIK